MSVLEAVKGRTCDSLGSRLSIFGATKVDEGKRNRVGALLMMHNL